MRTQGFGLVQRSASLAGALLFVTMSGVHAQLPAQVSGITGVSERLFVGKIDGLFGGDDIRRKPFGGGPGSVAPAEGPTVIIVEQRSSAGDNTTVDALITALTNQALKDFKPAWAIGVKSIKKGAEQRRTRRTGSGFFTFRTRRRRDWGTTL